MVEVSQREITFLSSFKNFILMSRKFPFKMLRNIRYDKLSSRHLPAQS